jgi:hypothetical protein
VKQSLTPAVRATVWLTLVTLLLVTPAAAATSRVAFRFQDPEIDESSGLVVAGETVVTVNDSGDSARVFVVDRSSGDTVGITTYAEEEPVDVEALAPGRSGTLWVGDIGDNDAERDHVTVHRIPTPVVGDRRVTATSFDLVYADGPRDAEALLVSPRTGRLYVVSKGILGGTVYAAPRRLRQDRTNLLTPVASAPGLVTDGTFLPDGRYAALRDYGGVHVLRARDFERMGDLSLPDSIQGEGLAALDGRTLLASSEGAGAPVHRRTVPPRLLVPHAPEAAEVPTPRGPEGEEVRETDGGAWGGNVVPLALGAAWALLLGYLLTLLVRWRRQSRSTT